MLRQAGDKDINHIAVREPDFGNSLTAIGLEGWSEGQRLCSSLPLAHKYDPPENARAKERRLYDVVQAMRECEQTEGQSVLDHGLSVASYLDELLDYLEGEPLRREWRLPEWVDTYREELRDAAYDRYTLRKYATFHDCGKPRCREVDNEGRVHFPDHAEVSAQVWREISDDERIEALIRHDMDVHTMKAKDIPAFIERPEAASLLLSALAEIHSNAAMFGGVDSTSFKIKWKQVKRRGKAACKALFGEKEECNA